MSTPDELLLLRIALLAILFGFVLFTAILLRSEGRVREARPVARSAGTARIVVMNGAHSGLARGESFVVAGEMALGRDPRNAIVVPDPSVSSVHASIARTGGAWRITDHGSTNGTSVAGRAIDGRGAALRPGDEIALGAVTFRFES